jgi:Raf kinase inhibitor-like YbhB/YbcL family protein
MRYLVLAVVLLSTACTGAEPTTTTTNQGGGTMQISSPAFDSAMPSRFTCDGFDVSPPLTFSGVPSNAASLVLIVDDPDAPDPAAPKMVWDHWVVWNIDPATRDVAEGRAPDGAVQGKNSWGRNDYGGPCPPIGTHRYFFKLYALDVQLDLPSDATKSTVEKAMQGHVLTEAELIGTYHQ